MFMQAARSAPRASVAPGTRFASPEGMWRQSRIWLTTVFSGSILCAGAALAEAPSSSAQSQVPVLYAGLESKFSGFAGGTAVLLGPEVCWTVRDAFALGLSAFLLVPGFYPLAAQGDIERLRLIYGNLRAGYVFLPDLPVHPTALVLFGAGGASVSGRGDTPGAGAAVFLVEPALELEFAPKAWSSLRMGVAVSYRKVFMPTIAEIDAASLSRFAGSVFARVALF
jgi:hypothetical protein